MSVMNLEQNYSGLSEIYVGGFSLLDGDREGCLDQIG